MFCKHRSEVRFPHQAPMKKCQIEGCREKYNCKGYCQNHYNLYCRDHTPKPSKIDWEKWKNFKVPCPIPFDVDPGEYVKFGVDKG